MITQDLPGASIFLSLLVNSPNGSDHRPENHTSRQREKAKARIDEESLFLLRATRGARNPNLQVVITQAWHVCSQHSFGLPLRMDGPECIDAL